MHSSERTGTDFSAVKHQSHQQRGGEVARLPMQENHSDCSGVAQQALVLGSSGYIQPNPTEPAQYAQLVDSHSIRSLTEI